MNDDPTISTPSSSTREKSVKPLAIFGIGTATLIFALLLATGTVQLPGMNHAGHVGNSGQTVDVQTR